MGETDYEPEEEALNRRNRRTWQPRSSLIDNGTVDLHPFFIKVEESRRPASDPLPDIHRTLEKSTSKFRLQEKGTTRRGFSSFFKFHRGCQADATQTTPGNVSTVLPLMPLHVPTLTDIENNETFQTAVLEAIPRKSLSVIGLAGDLEDISSLRSLSYDHKLVSGHNGDIRKSLEDLSIYQVLNTRCKAVGVGDFTSINFEVEDLNDEGNVVDRGDVFSRPNTQEHPWRPLTLDGRPNTSERKTTPLFTPSAGITSRVLAPLREGAGGEAFPSVDDLESWMSRLPPILQRIPLNHLYIPGECP